MRTRKTIIISFIIAVAAGVVVEWVTPNLFLLGAAWIWVISAGTEIWTWAWTTTPVWNAAFYGMILILAVALVAAVVGIIRSLRRPEWYKYAEDIFDGVLWRWRYSDRRIVDLVPLCPNCDMALAYRSSLKSAGWGFGQDAELFCERCDDAIIQKYSGPYHQLEHSIIRKVDRNIRTGDWKEIVSKRTSARP
jgi:hypothetical protein